MNKISVILALTIALISLMSSAQIDDHPKFKMFCEAFNNHSTTPNYIVITVRNMNTGEEKEICTEAPFLRGAINYETGEWGFSYKKHKTRYFKFHQDSALLNISFNLYTKDDLDKYTKKINVSEIVNQVKNGKLTTKTFMGDKKEQLMFAHLMFNNGVMMTRGCIAGNICKLTYFNKE